jgi:hypothetical protein
MGSMTTNGYIGYSKKNGVIKMVSIDDDVEIDQVGIELNEFFKDLSDVKDLVKTSIGYISDGEITYIEDLEFLTDEEFEFVEYENREDFICDMEPGMIYYLFENNTWTVASRDSSEFKELDTLLEEY